jgi:phage baseplate assembly protein W
MSWALPLQLEPGGSFPIERPDPYLDTVRLILGVAPGERRLLPEFGWGGHLLPDLADPVQGQMAAFLAEEALRRWAPHLEVERVEVVFARNGRVGLELRRGGRSDSLEIGLAR